jgi:hypothetical protein
MHWLQAVQIVPVGGSTIGILTEGCSIVGCVSRCFRNVGKRYHMKPNHVSEDCVLHNHCCENHMSNIIKSVVIFMKVIILKNFLKPVLCMYCHMYG